MKQSYTQMSANMLHLIHRHTDFSWLTSTWTFASEQQCLQHLFLVFGHPHLVHVYNCTATH